MPSLAGALVLVLLVSCNAEKKKLEQAEQERAGGDLDRALATLELLMRDAPSTPEAEEAKKKGTAWLIEAADRAGSTAERKVRLEQALQWSPASGAAQARLCSYRVEMKDYPGARRCVDEELAGKEGVPAEIVARVRSELDKNARAANDDERKRLAASPSAHHWKALIERYPDSPEAQQAKLKLQRHGSLCADVDGYLSALEKERERQEKLAAAVADARDAASSLSERVAAYEKIGRESGFKARELGQLVGNLDVHELRPGEETAKAELRAALQDLADSAAALEDDLERHTLENLDSYDATAFAALKKWAAAAGKLLARSAKRITAVEAQCAPARSP